MGKLDPAKYPVMRSARYQALLAVGEQYERFVIDQLRRRQPTLAIRQVHGRTAQYHQGDTTIGLEIKYDHQMHRTGNLYLEISEKTDPDLPRFTPSGIYRVDQSWLYGIGNYQEFFVFIKDRLITRVESRHLVKRQIPTSMGFLLPLGLAHEWADRHLIWI